MTTAHLTLKSRNKKVGPVPVSTTSRNSCPTDCPFKNNGCYAANFPLASFWNKVDAGEAGADWDTFCKQIANLPDGQFWRHNQAGDLPGDGIAISSPKLQALIDANQGKRGFTYTHYQPYEHINDVLIKNSNRDGFTINLSANNLEHADELADLDIGPVVVVLPADHNKRNVNTPGGRNVVTCPATYRSDISCATCQLCQKRDRKSIVGFPAHGAARRKASAVAGAA